VTQQLYFRNRQRRLKINTPALRHLTAWLLREGLGRRQYQLGFYFVGTAEITRLNEQFLHHRGSTDVITFDYGDPNHPELLMGEIFVCVDEAVLQSRRFGTTSQNELVRYLVHGVLHLCGYDDRPAPARRRMKRQENRLLRCLTSRGNLLAPPVALS
jgi:probable rRNA maturation factor